MMIEMSQEKNDHYIGVISDTHGLLRQEALDALRGCDVILHAGDVGGQEILEALGEIAPVYAVRGNMDGGGWAQALPKTRWVEIGEIAVYLLHDLMKLDLVPHAAGISMVVHGHTHQPKEEVRDGVCYLNPGSAGPRRFSRPVSLAIVHVEGKEMDIHSIHLDT
jgi:putative phosphoesterase